MTEDELDRTCSILNSSQSFKGKWPLCPSHPSWLIILVMFHLAGAWHHLILSNVEVSGKSGAVPPQEDQGSEWTAAPIRKYFVNSTNYILPPYNEMNYSE